MADLAKDEESVYRLMEKADSCLGRGPTQSREALPNKKCVFRAK